MTSSDPVRLGVWFALSSTASSVVFRKLDTDDFRYPLVKQRRSFRLNLIAHTTFTVTVAICSHQDLRNHQADQDKPLPPIYKVVKTVYASPYASPSHVNFHLDSQKITIGFMIAVWLTWRAAEVERRSTQLVEELEAMKASAAQQNEELEAVKASAAQQSEELEAVKANQNETDAL
ncbi:uncharacterized protein LOC112179013 [Rosa chinensis]|uniref:uncharacterized protein LOC112179013 n=1 Tax=Rosa chinensis TaxID=74649 RepID=UPI001AD8CEC4|nr:uncharacterized protein LOC112179013 [Rosa chinensis]